ncbi:MAG: hypothetical protein H6712_18245 [Myxococcales bacterium]|nr:hypothetical protein [Myxococcales bacterium]MCB9715814.1 hypothetical protein [Myxococcales bacterium]
MDSSPTQVPQSQPGWPAHWQLGLSLAPAVGAIVLGVIAGLAPAAEHGGCTPGG